jgi:SAM-dependent methyltransferase
MGLYRDVVFPWLMDLSLAGMADDRRDLLAGATGRTLEIGVGTGLNLPFYPEAVSDLTLLTPEFPLHERLKRRMQGLRMRHRFVIAGAEALPFPDASFDTVVATLVFCTIPDAAAAAREVRRVLKPGGRLLTLEHVRSPDARVARWQRRLAPLWTHVGCGCHLDRDTRGVFAGAGLDLSLVQDRHRPGLPIVSDFVMGEAHAPG